MSLSSSMNSGDISRLKEDEAIESLISCSENAHEEPHDFERVVATSSWLEAATGWKRTEPNAVYLTSERKKKAPKEKTSRSSPTLSDSESYFQKVKKLAGMIANSNVQSTTAANGWQNNRLNNNKGTTNLVKFQNVGVLSYEVPCWRYIVDPRTCSYVERKPLQILRNFSERNNRTALLDGGGSIGFQEVNGEMFFVDPALSFDRHLLETLDKRKKFRLMGETCNSHVVPPSTSCRPETINHIQFVHPSFSSHSSTRVERLKTNLANADDSKRHRSPNDSSPSDLKPLQKVTPTQRRVAEDSLLASRMLLARAREMKSDSSTQLNSNKKTKTKKTKSNTIRLSDSRVDWIPITKSTVGVHYHPHIVTAQINDGRFQDTRACGGKLKGNRAISLHRANKGKLTLTEAANLVPSGGVKEALGKLTKDLENKTGSGLGLGMSISQHLLPAVSGAKFAMFISDAAET